MMNITINGEPVEENNGISISALLINQKVKMPDMVSVELNDNIIDRKIFNNTILKEGDKIEFLYFMGGGNS